MVKDVRWKLIRYTVEGSTSEQLFDLEADPHELTNLIDDPRIQKRRAQLNTALDQWWADYV